VTTFLLIRHGSTALVGNTLAGRLPGLHLDAAGRKQAQELALRLEKREIAAIYSSPLERARETAEPLAGRLGQQIRIHEAFNEIDFGSWQGKHVADLEGDAHWSRFNALRSITHAPEGELMLEAQSRVVHALEELRQIHPEETVAVVSHADVIKSALLLYFGAPLDSHLRLDISPASVSVLELSEWGPRITAVNC
jgi:probable phosphomutase (TIGR03848 family)